MTEQPQDQAPLSSRRDFLKTTTIAAAGTAVAANLSILSNAYAGGSDAIKVGLVGCGGRGSGAADNVLHAAPNVKIIAIGDVFKFRTHNLRKHLAYLASSDKTVKKLGNSVDLPEERCFVGLDAYQKVLDAGIDYVILATPPGFRPIHLEAAVAAGKHIFTEKPVGVDGPGIRKVLATYAEAVRKGLGIGAGTQRHHQLGYVQTMKRIHDGAIGDLVAARCYWNGGNIWFRSRRELIDQGVKPTELAYQLHNWYHFGWLSGDHICEQHVHNLDVVNWALKAHPLRAVGMGGRAARPSGDPVDVGNIFDFFAIDYEYPRGVHVLSQCRQIAHCENSVSEGLVGSRGMCLTNADTNTYTINGEHVISRKQAKDSTDPYVQEHTDLIESIRSGKPYNELKNVAQSTLTAIMGRMSAYTGKAVSWEQALHSRAGTMPDKLHWDMSVSVPPVAVPGKTPLV